MAKNTIVLLISSAFILGSRITQAIELMEESSKSDSTPSSKASFPEELSRYKLVEANQTQIKNQNAPKMNATIAEILDMLHAPAVEYLERTDTWPEERKQPYDANESAKMSNIVENPNMQSEFIEGPNEVVERDDPLRGWRHIGHDHEHGGRMGMYQSNLAGITIGITMLVVLVAYIGIVAWKRCVLLRNGTKHELLPNDDVERETRIEL